MCGWSRGLYGWGPDYGTGGYVVTLSLNRTEALATLQQMKQDLCVRTCARDFREVSYGAPDLHHA